jgi:hypothetical protein
MFIAGGERLANYRLYCLDRNGKIAAAEWVEAVDDAAAIAAAHALAKPTICELWLNNRLVEQIPPAQAGNSLAASGRGGPTR